MKIGAFYKLVFFVILLIPSIGAGQTTELTHHGTLPDTFADGLYDFEFRLFDSVTGGTFLGVQQRLGVTLKGGRYTVRLDFGNAFPGAPRFLEVAYKTAPGAFIPLSPREPVTSAPYAIRSLSAAAADQVSTACVGCVTDANIDGISADKITGQIPVSTIPGGSGHYIQNTTTAQPAADFNISGTGTANIINAATQYNIGGQRFLSTPGTVNPYNTFVGLAAGGPNYNSMNGSFFGFSAGGANTFGFENSFFGSRAGASNTEGNTNSYFGAFAGHLSTTANGNSFFGKSAGRSTTRGSTNTFIGTNAGDLNTEGFGNVFVGTWTGKTNRDGYRNTIIGSHADVASSELIFATAIGSDATVATSNTIVLGRSAGEDRVRMAGNLNVGGTTVLNGPLAVAGNSISIFTGKVTINTLGSAGSTSLCRNASYQISTCSSSLRYKTNIIAFGSGLDLIRRLKPITFDWKEGGMHDLGLGAEDVAAIEPLLVTYNKDGQVEGVKYDRIGVVLINAVKEQQRLIEDERKEIAAQKTVIEKQQAEIDLLKAHLCSQTPSAVFCRPRN